MRTWNLGIKDIYQLILAADYRCSAPNYSNDHIYELILEGGEPPAMALYTTYGLRARSMRLFPRFSKKDQTLVNPLDFKRPPRVARLYPNYLQVMLSPFGSMDVQIEYLAFSSQVLGGRITFANPSVIRDAITFEMDALLSPLGKGAGMAALEMGMHTVLGGESDELCVLFFMTGAPQPGQGPFAGLSLEVDLNPGESRQVCWGLTAQADFQSAYDIARQACALTWDAEVARIDLINQSDILEITTGDPDWDAVFMLAQRTAYQLVFPGTEKLPYASFVQARLPDHGFSMRADGSDYNHLWNGQTALHADYLANLLLPARPDLAAGWVENFLSSQKANGFVDWKPGLAGQRSGRLAQPLIASLAWRVHQCKDNPKWLQRVYPGLLSFFRFWLEGENDQDRDGFPEFNHPYQSGLDESPLFDLSQEASQAVEPRAVETPALAAMLYKEASALQEMALALNLPQDAAWLSDRMQDLRRLVDETWDESAVSYLYRDAVTHHHPSGATLALLKENGRFETEKDLGIPQRLVLKFKGQREMTRRTHVRLAGKFKNRQISEDIPARAMQWLHGIGRYTTSRHFTYLKDVVVKSMAPDEFCEVATIDFNMEDISLLLPIWASIPSKERARQIVEETIQARYQRAFGLAVCPQGRKEQHQPPCQIVRPEWNRLIIEGLLNYGYIKEAASLFESLMTALIQTYRSQHANREYYNGLSGQGGGERNSLTGLAPVGLFLRVLGLQILSDNKVSIRGFNPFPWPVTVQYRGNTIEFFHDSTRITFRGRQPVNVSGEGTHVVSLE